MQRYTVTCTTPELVGEERINPDVEMDVEVTINATVRLGYGQQDEVKVESIRRVSDGAEILMEVDVDEVWRLGQFAYYGENEEDWP